MGAKQLGLKIEAKRLGGKRLGGNVLGAKRLVTILPNPTPPRPTTLPPPYHTPSNYHLLPCPAITCPTLPTYPPNPPTHSTLPYPTHTTNPAPPHPTTLPPPYHTPSTHPLSPASPRSHDSPLLKWMVYHLSYRGC